MAEDNSIGSEATAFFEMTVTFKSGDAPFPRWFQEELDKLRRRLMHDYRYRYVPESRPFKSMRELSLRSPLDPPKPPPTSEEWEKEIREAWENEEAGRG